MQVQGGRQRQHHHHHHRFDQHQPHLHHQQRIEGSGAGQAQAGPFRVKFACPCGKTLRYHMATVSAKGSVTFSHLCGNKRYKRNIRLAKAEEEMREHGVIQVHEQKGK